MTAKSRVWVYLPENLEKTIMEEVDRDKGTGDRKTSISRWIVNACAQYLKLRDQGPPGISDQERSEYDQQIKALNQERTKALEELQALKGSYTKLEGEHKEQAARYDQRIATLDEDRNGARDELQALMVKYATLEGEHKGQAAMIEALRDRVTHDEGVIQELTQKIPVMITDGKTRPSWWDRFMGRG